MNRSTLDRLVSSTGLVVTIVLLAASVGLFYTYNFIHTQVHDQLAQQKITFPEAGSYPFVSHSVIDMDRGAMGMFEAS